ncbi:MAG: carboxypeptidase-like regulatory domain-containing protein, partial [Gemmatimonadales bacterium]|nr:carboxypeptidase-like regulatory domain-containing protein [Gemmatimonadales bacterium]
MTFIPFVLLQHLRAGGACAGALLACIPLAALHSQTGRIEGTVSNAETGAPIARAEVVVAATELSVITDSKGAFLLSDVPAGVYELLVRAVGFQSKVYLDQAVLAGAVAILDARLEPGAGSMAAPERVTTLPPGFGGGVALGYDGLGSADGAIGSSGAFEAFGRYGFTSALFLRAGVLV